MTVRIGARWDDPVQDDRIRRAFAAGTVDYIEVNYPVPYDADPCALGFPILAHTSNNPTCSANGINLNIAKRIRADADAARSPWIGEHLSWLGAAPSGALGYQINPLFTADVARVTAANVRRLRDFYGREIALELSPVYTPATGYESEMHFLGAVAEMADTLVILDVTHWQIANRNLDRDARFGLDAIDPARIRELHIAGMSLGRDGRFWHDAHREPPTPEILALVAELAATLPAVEAVTFEHHYEAPEEAFHRCLGEVGAALRHVRAA